MSKELECLKRLDTKNYLTEREHKEFYSIVEQALKRLESIDNAEPSEALECLEEMWELSCDSRKPEYTLYEAIKQALQRLNKYEQVLGDGRLTDRNYKNTTLDLDSCKPYLRLGQLEDIYEESK